MSAPALAESWLELPDGKLFWLKGRCAVGRQADNDLVLEVNSVSRHHALIAAEAAGCTLSDLHSSNGTFVNRSPVTQRTILRDGDELRFGDATVRFRCQRPVEPESAAALPDRTRRLDGVRERACWLLLVEADGYAALKAQLGSKAALERFHAWIAGMRPLIEHEAGHIHRYVGDAIFAWWPADTVSPAQLGAALAAIEKWRRQSPLAFRLVLHHGSVHFTRGERGEELSGQEVNFVFRAESVARSFGAPTMLSESAMHALKLDGKCAPLGAASIEGIRGRFVFFAPPAATV